MSYNTFRLIGVKPLAPRLLTELNKKDLVRVERIQKALFGKFYWHYFVQGFDIKEDEDVIVSTPEAVHAYSIFDTSSLKVSISAVVGKNGKGKSSLVDLVIRIINNMSAALMGEGYNFAAAEHLHFIDNVFASLAFQIGGVIYVLEERGRNIRLTSFRRSRNSGYNFNKVQEIPILQGSRNLAERDNPLKKNPQGRRMLKSLFYTMVCNYSLYGFNYKEYQDETTPYARLLQINPKIGGDATDENHSWLKGIFHKNDGYQTPIVLHPMRNDGQLNVNSENHLANERMAALLFYVDADGNRPFRKINDLDVVAIRLKPSHSQRYMRENMLYTLDIGKTRNISKNFEVVYNAILSFWDSRYGFLSNCNKRHSSEEACDYIVYKTLKIISNYKKYSPIRTYISKQVFDQDELAAKLEPLFLDYTHVTKKLLQAINYLLHGIYNPEEACANLDTLDKRLQPFFEANEHKGKHKMLRACFLPPPIFDTEIILSHADHNGIIPFDRLSSGERQFAYTISNFLYHLVNIDSAWNDYYHDKDHAEVVKYHYVNVIFDEVELYFHPDMQRKFVSYLMQSLRSARFSENLRGVNIIMATHSPFILSDVPHNNILCVGEEKQHIEASFGANIISLLADGFFMDSTLGQYAKDQIREVVEYYHTLQHDPAAIVAYAEKRQRYRFLSQYVSEPYLKSMICRMVDSMEQQYKQSKRHNPDV